MKKYTLILMFCFYPIFAKGQTVDVVAPLLESLRVGQKVSISEAGGMYKIDLLDKGNIGVYKITDLTQTYIGLIDIVGITTIKIPTTSISAVIITNTKKVQ
jgi:hypothetical protein